jgi:hypothetical protein
MRKLEMAIWLDYIKLFILRCKREVEFALSDDMSLKEPYHKFVDVHRNELIELMQRP